MMYRLMTIKRTLMMKVLFGKVNHPVRLEMPVRTNPRIPIPSINLPTRGKLIDTKPECSLIYDLP